MSVSADHFAGQWVHLAEDEWTVVGQVNPDVVALPSGGVTLTSAGKKWEPGDHPRGKDGKFIEKGYLSSYLQMYNPLPIYAIKAIDSITQDQWNNLKPEQKQYIVDNLVKLSYEGDPGAEDALNKIDKLKYSEAAAGKADFQPKGALKQVLDNDKPGIGALINAVQDLDQETWKQLDENQKQNVADKVAKYPLKPQQKKVAGLQAGDVQSKSPDPETSAVPTPPKAPPATQTAVKSGLPVSPVSQKKGAPGYPLKITTGVIWGKHPGVSVVAESKTGDAQLIWDESSKKYVRQESFTSPTGKQGWKTTDIWSKKVAYENLKNDNTWVVPVPEKTDESPKAPDIGGNDPHKLYQKGLLTSEEYSALGFDPDNPGVVTPKQLPANVQVEKLGELLGKLKTTGALDEDETFTLADLMTQPAWDAMSDSDKLYLMEDLETFSVGMNETQGELLQGKLIKFNGGKHPKTNDEGGSTDGEPTDTVSKMVALGYTQSQIDAVEAFESDANSAGSTLEAWEALQEAKKQLPKGVTDAEAVALMDKALGGQSDANFYQTLFADLIGTGDDDTAASPETDTPGNILPVSATPGKSLSSKEIYDLVVKKKPSYLDGTAIALSPSGQAAIIKVGQDYWAAYKTNPNGPWVSTSIPLPSVATIQLIKSSRNDWVVPDVKVAGDYVLSTQVSKVPDAEISYSSEDVISNWDGVASKEYEWNDVVALDVSGKKRVSKATTGDMFRIEEKNEFGTWDSLELVDPGDLGFVIEKHHSGVWVVPPVSKIDKPGTPTQSQSQMLVDAFSGLPNAPHGTVLLSGTDTHGVQYKLTVNKLGSTPSATLRRKLPMLSTWGILAGYTDPDQLLVDYGGVTWKAGNQTTQVTAPTASPASVSEVGVGGADISGVSTYTKNVIKGSFKNAKIGYWSKPEKIWDTIQHAKTLGGTQNLTDLQIIKILDAGLKTKESDPYEKKMVKWLQTSKGLAHTKGAQITSTAPTSPTQQVSTPATPDAGIGDLLGKGDTGHLTSDKKQTLYTAFKGQPATYLTSPPTDIYAALKEIGQDNNLSTLQMLRVIDEVGAQKVNATDEHLFEKKIKDWLKSPQGAAVASGKPIPLPATPAYSPGVSDAQIPSPSESDKLTYKVVSSGDAYAASISSHGKYGEWTASQNAALRTYTGGSYYTINSYLYGKTSEASATHMKTIKQAQLGMRPSTRPMLLHRGVHFDGIAGSKDHNSLSKTVGTTWKSGGFFSTSVGGHAAFGSKPVLLEVEAPPGTPMAWVEPISKHPGENEMLLAAGLHYKILSVTKSGGKSVVRVRVVPAPKETT